MQFALLSTYNIYNIQHAGLQHTYTYTTYAIRCETLSDPAGCCRALSVALSTALSVALSSAVDSAVDSAGRSGGWGDPYYY